MPRPNEYSLTYLSDAEVNLIYEALSEMPHKRVTRLIGKIIAQIEEQQEKTRLESSKPPEPPEPALPLEG